MVQLGGNRRLAASALINLAYSRSTDYRLYQRFVFGEAQMTRRHQSAWAISIIELSQSYIEAFAIDRRPHGGQPKDPRLTH
jgi:hypothetical protein